MEGCSIGAEILAGIFYIDNLPINDVITRKQTDPWDVPRVLRLEGRMLLVRMVGKAIQEGLFWVLGIALTLYVWISDPATIVWATDFNLDAIKLICKFLPAYYGALVESGLRLGLGIDKTLLSLEGIAVIKSFFFLISKISHGLYYLLFGNFGRARTPAP